MWQKGLFDSFRAPLLFWKQEGVTVVDVLIRFELRYRFQRDDELSNGTHDRQPICGKEASLTRNNKSHLASTASRGSCPSVTGPSKVVVAVVLGIGLTFGLAGCATLKHKPVPDNVVEARQFSLSGIDAMQRYEWEKAEGLFSKAIDTCPADERAHQQYAEALWHRDARTDAIAHLERSVALSGGDPHRRVRLGEMYLALGQTDQAWEQVEAAIGAQRKLASAWALRGDILRKQGRLEEAVVNYHRALSNQPQYPHVQLAVAAVYREMNRPRRALATLEVLATQYPPSEVPQELLLQQGLALKAMDRYDDAVMMLAAAARQGEPTLDVLYHLGDAQLAAGDTANARLAARRALILAPHNEHVRQLDRRINEQHRRMTALVEWY
ncbi:MAG TPA: tetratricopeptide repeat protein [Pirellulaceae bacterium]|nr:tetratricopeptide repeat protein [Pirellulaceae bacterium]